MTAINAPAGKLDIGDVIAQTFKMIGRNLAPFLIMAFVLVGIPNLLLGLLGLELGSGSVGVNSIAWAISGGLISAVAALVLQGAIIHGTISDMNGRKANVVDGLTTGLRSFFPLF